MRIFSGLILVVHLCMILERKTCLAQYSCIWQGNPPRCVPPSTRPFIWQLHGRNLRPDKPFNYLRYSCTWHCNPPICFPLGVQPVCKTRTWKSFGRSIEDDVKIDVPKSSATYRENDEEILCNELELCTEVGALKSREECSKNFCKCDESGKWIVQTCPEELLFDRITNRCEWKISLRNC